MAPLIARITLASTILLALLALPAAADAMGCRYSYPANRHLYAHMDPLQLAGNAIFDPEGVQGELLRRQLVEAHVAQQIQLLTLHEEQIRSYHARRNELLQQRREAYQQWQQQRATLLQNWQPPPPILLSDEDRARIKLKQARSFVEFGQRSDAIEYCERVLKHHPGTQAAKEARGLLAQLKS